ncbi:MAG: hypothetical protein AMK71_10350 [Nitrospira bacterium SG8_35_4]|nr:MAG: hypothetical protein AMK71_10350 [Nitrospira bacterium SG8_35_4]
MRKEFTLYSNKTVIRSLLPFIAFLLLFHVHAAFGWHDETHLAVAQVSGYHKWFNAAGADMAKIKAGSIEGYNHFFNNNSNVQITPSVIMKQIDRYNNPRDEEGHLYGAVLASLREYKKALDSGKYGEYHLSFCAHYITDLSQPLHNMPYDDFNRQYHSSNDGIVNEHILNNLQKIKDHMHEISLRPDHFEEDLAREIAGIANVSAKLGHTLKKEKRTMTQAEAYRQLGRSASLLAAVLVCLNN